MLDLRALGWCALAVVLVSAVLSLAQRWWCRRSVTRLIARVRRDQERGIEDQARLYPESLSVVRCSESEVSCTHPDGTAESVAFVGSEVPPRMKETLW